MPNHHKTPLSKLLKRWALRIRTPGPEGERKKRGGRGRGGMPEGLGDNPTCSKIFKIMLDRGGLRWA